MASAVQQPPDLRRASSDYSQTAAPPSLSRWCSPAAAAQPDLEAGRHPASETPLTSGEQQAGEAWSFAPQGWTGTQPAVKLRLAKGEGDDATVAQQLQRMWAENGSPVDDDGWPASTQAHLEAGRARLKLRAWLAEVDGCAVGCTVAQLFDGFHGPAPLQELGYILGAYVLPDHRQLGVGKLLTNQAVTYLRSLGCTRVMLHAAPAGKPVYKPLQLTSTDDMRLDRTL